MDSRRGDTRDARKALLLSLALGLGFLLLCLWNFWQRASVELAYDKVSAALLHGGKFGDVLQGQLLSFMAAAVAVHLVFGSLAWCLALLSDASLSGAKHGRRLRMVVFWFLVLASLVLIGNSTWFPASSFAIDYSWIRANWFGLQFITALLAILALAVAIMLAIVLLRHRPRLARNFRVASAPTLVLVAATLALPSSDTSSAPKGIANEKPHIIILGIDSLRNEFAGARGNVERTPNLDRFLAGAHRFSDTVTPLARTYGAWTAILTGRHPVSTNARFNLMPRDLVYEGETLGDALQAVGYRSVYATDEVRFANFDESYGFEQLITPPTGAIDFLLGKIGDLPLINLIAGTNVGGFIFPSNHGNRAAHITYEPSQFTERLRRDLIVDRPGFYAIHLTLSHWPYSWAGIQTPSTPQEYRPAYERAIAEADRQFGEIMQVLAEKSVLDNAIVVVVSDHGEALGWHSDSMLRGVGTGEEIWNSMWGHGTSVLSPHQYQVLFAARAFGQAQLPGDADDYPWPVTLEDIRPTLQQLVMGRAPLDTDGLSLLPYLTGSTDPTTLRQRIRFTETGFNTKLVMAGKYNESGLVNEAAAYYELSAATGWMQLRQDRLPELLAQKQRAALSSDMLLAAVPNLDGNSIAYWLTDRHNPTARRITARPDPATEGEAARLWDALRARFPGELPSQSAGPPT